MTVGLMLAFATKRKHDEGERDYEADGETSSPMTARVKKRMRCAGTMSSQPTVPPSLTTAVKHSNSLPAASPESHAGWGSLNNGHLEHLHSPRVHPFPSPLSLPDLQALRISAFPPQTSDHSQPRSFTALDNEPRCSTPIEARRRLRISSSGKKGSRAWGGAGGYYEWRDGEDMLEDQSMDEEDGEDTLHSTYDQEGREDHFSVSWQYPTLTKYTSSHSVAVQDTESNTISLDHFDTLHISKVYPPIQPDIRYEHSATRNLASSYSGSSSAPDLHTPQSRDKGKGREGFAEASSPDHEGHIDHTALFSERQANSVSREPKKGTEIMEDTNPQPNSLSWFCKTPPPAPKQAKFALSLNTSSQESPTRTRQGTPYPSSESQDLMYTPSSRSHDIPSLPTVQERRSVKSKSGGDDGGRRRSSVGVTIKTRDMEGEYRRRGVRFRDHSE